MDWARFLISAVISFIIAGGGVWLATDGENPLAALIVGLIASAKDAQAQLAQPPQKKR